MRRTMNVIRLQLINKGTFVWYPLIILASAVVISVIIYAMIPFDEPKYGGGGQAPLWYFFAVGMSAMTLTFPFSQAMSITRREFFLGTMLTAVLASALMGVLFLIGGGIEVATNGYGVNGYVFYLPWLWDAGPGGAFVVYFTLALFFFVVGFTGATIYKSWGQLVLIIVSVGLSLLLVGLLFVATRLDLWNEVGAAIMELGALGIALWALLVTAVFTVVSFLAFRRTIP
ncbi:MULTISPECIES: hypothetical protein [unclassified Microbacterium]|uniref:hypothetical protein n=1 Tax=unclassified Microbacterium TaxID=2609290 RepID=UPI000EA984E5|nr:MULTISPECIES: hypothetical protein [unclassified Microbacterium]MBT2484197.1 hypothetical protein [Microbacterium sp. ISL-108]RKN67132.1 hypothetical protein D7252_05740 [Microbacterium sp. CGR2]